jgi:hypothetical protein
MILSHKHRFIFIKGVKVAGTSAEIALSQICGPDDIVTPISPADERFRNGTAGEPRNFAADRSVEREFRRALIEKEPGEIRLPQDRFYNHMSLSEVLDLVPEASSYELRFVERSPYAKAISLANWQANRAAYDRGMSLAKNAEGLIEAMDQIIADGTIAKVRNIDRYRHPDGRILSAGWRFESLQQSLDRFILEKTGRPVELVHAKAGFGSESVDVRTSLTPSQIDHINRLFADEFETFGYRQIERAIDLRGNKDLKHV